MNTNTLFHLPNPLPAKKRYAIEENQFPAKKRSAQQVQQEKTQPEPTHEEEANSHQEQASKPSYRYEPRQEQEQKRALEHESNSHQEHAPKPNYRYNQCQEKEQKQQQEQGVVANCLLLLANTGSRFEPDQHQSSSREYECKTCSRRFPSFQALGGHRASHNKPKGTGDCGGINGQQLEKGSKSKEKVHECTICGSEFSLGQALGGHMRRHRGSVDGFSNNGSSPVVKRSNSRRVLCIDLNLPPLEEEDLEVLGKGLFLGRVGMVDCLY